VAVARNGTLEPAPACVQETAGGSALPDTPTISRIPGEYSYIIQK
jgi:hypothetical protein